MKMTLNHQRLFFKQLPLRRFYVKYIQGQSPEPRIREYFYYIDHQGMLFLDDARVKNFTSCFKEKQFLAFFFQRLKMNTTDRYPEFPFLSVCGKEKNYIRCDDCPIVFTSVQKVDNRELLCYNHADTLLTVPFQPDKIHMDFLSGRVYHPGPENGGEIGLIMSKLAIEFSKFFDFENTRESPSHFTWNGVKYALDADWYKKVRKF